MMNKVSIIEVEADAYLPNGGYGYISGRSTVMARSIKSALRIAAKEVSRQLAAQSITGGTPIARQIIVNGKTGFPRRPDCGNQVGF